MSPRWPNALPGEPINLATLHRRAPRERTGSTRVWRDAPTGLRFEWGGEHSHTVNVRRPSDRVDADCFSVGDFAKHGATQFEVERGIVNYLRAAEAGER